MKKKFTTIVLSGLLACGIVVTANTALNSHKDKENEKIEIPVEEGKITIDKTTHDFGTISKEDGSVSTTFTIQNNMDKPILITQVRPSCGCTTPVWTKEPIEPGKTGEIQIAFDAKSVAPFNKSIVIMTNGDPQRIVTYIKGVVE